MRIPRSSLCRPAAAGWPSRSRPPLMRVSGPAIGQTRSGSRRQVSTRASWIPSWESCRKTVPLPAGRES